MKLSRRIVLRGLAGATLSLPLLEGLAPRGRPARADADADESPFVIFFRQASGVAMAWDAPPYLPEPERFWPREVGPLTAASVEGRALDELGAHLDRLLVVGGVDMYGFPYGDGHALGALGMLTAQPPVEPLLGEGSEPAGESLDHRIGRELNPDGRESLFLQAGPGAGMGGPCLSWRGPGQRRSAIRDPGQAYLSVIGSTEEDDTLHAQIFLRRESINDILRAQLSRIAGRRELSSLDRRRLAVHQEAVRDLELRVAARLDEETTAALDGLGPKYDSPRGDDVLEAVRLHADVAAFAVACGVTRSVVIQVGDGADNETHYRDLRTGLLMEGFHYISHRRIDGGDTGPPIPDADIQHHMIDRQFAQTFDHLLRALSSYETRAGGDLLDTGVAAWLNDIAHGATHTHENLPVVLAGSAGGQLRQGEHLRLRHGGVDNHARFLNTIGAAVGLTSADGRPLDDFGNDLVTGGRLPELLSDG